MRVNRTFLLLLAGWLAGMSPASGWAQPSVPDPPRSLPPASSLEKEFDHPPKTARPWVYWFFMDGNLTREGITADLEAMQSAGLGGAIILEVGIGMPRGPVEFMSPAWRTLIKHAFAEADRLDLELALGAGPGWCGTGGPWVRPEQSMQHLVASETNIAGPGRFDAVLPRPQPRRPFFGEDSLTPELRKVWQTFYRDEAVLAVPTPAGQRRLAESDEKALYYRPPYSSQPGVKAFLPTPADYPVSPPAECIDSSKTLDLTSHLRPDGRLVWDAPKGSWTILRFGRTITGQTTRPAPTPGLGLESDKFEQRGLDAHFQAYLETLLKTTGEPRHAGRGFTTLHFDSWEMGAQNWSEHFRAEFAKRRGYDPLRFLPAMLGRVVDRPEISERFLWDLRQTAQELVVENHATRLRDLGRRHHLALSLEPYDLNPCADLKLGGVADVPMGEFWSKGYAFPTEYSCIEAVSLAHTFGRAVVGAEAFTALPEEAWQQYPGSMKAQTDWALATGINRFVFHRYQAQPRLDQWPGMTMGPYGVHWERTQTWWDMVPAYHTYLARAQHLLRQGLPVADILYLTPEGAPQVFRAPRTATQGDPPDRRSYNFDGCAPDTLLARASVRQNRLVFPDGMSYGVVVLPRVNTMTPALLAKLEQLVKAGAVVIGSAPRRSPSLSNYPRCDQEVQRLAAQVWDSGSRRHVIPDAIEPTGTTSLTNTLAAARWIWYPEGNPAVSAPPGRRYFRSALTLAKPITAAEFTLTADNSFALFINGHAAGTGDNFHQAPALDATSQLEIGTNWITITAENTGAQPNPAGLIGKLVIIFRDGSSTVLATDGHWSSSLTPNGPWTAALELGPCTMPPWNLQDSAPPEPELYPNYGMVASVLAKMGVAPDFETDGSLRYLHRHLADAEVYFVANRESRPQTTSARFRVSGRQPEWWNPLTGQRRDLPQFEEKNARTTIPLRLEPHESGFVIFRRPAPRTSSSSPNFPESKPVLTLTAPWEVAFDPKWGGPEKVTFTRLEDWKGRPEPGLKYYSGKAVYRTRFDLGNDLAKAATSHWFLSLGTVKNLASIRLNGHDLGTAWCAPWRVEIPRDGLRAQDNLLEITVANLWINRLIGDSALLEAQRLTRTTWNPYHPNSPLQESGLLGPVTLDTR